MVTLSFRSEEFPRAPEEQLQIPPGVVAWFSVPVMHRRGQGVWVRVEQSDQDSAELEALRAKLHTLAVRLNAAHSMERHPRYWALEIRRILDGESG